MVMRTSPRRKLERRFGCRRFLDGWIRECESIRRAKGQPRLPGRDAFEDRGFRKGRSSPAHFTFAESRTTPSGFRSSGKDLPHTTSASDVSHAGEEARRGVMFSLVSDVATGYFGLLELDRALVLLDALNAAPSLEPLRALQLHALTGNRKGRYAMTVNARWRITFRFAAGHADDVAIEDYHRG